MTKAQTGVVLPVIRRIKEKAELPIDSSAEERNFIAEMASKKPRKPRKPAVKAEIPVAPVEERNFIVGIGASAGGLEALSDLIGSLPDDLGVPYIVVQHLSPTHRSMMVPLLARETSMLVKDAEDGEIPLANVVYVTPANWNIILKDGVMRLLVPGKTVMPKPSATALFNSMAEEKGEDAIGVILSGTGSDGAAGIAAIKAAGGFTFAQDPEAAKYSGMPQAAISTGCVEWVLTCRGIAEEITAIARAHGLINRATKQENAPATMKGLLQMVYKHSKIDFSGYKEATLSRRVERRMAANRLNNLAAYFDYCSKNPDELNKLSKDILISVTAFFRDRNSFEGLRKILADIVALKQTGDEIRIWVPACATGEEAYSIGILLSDILGSKLSDYRIQIFATDIDMDAMAVARKGIYNESSLTEVSADTTARYFSKHADTYEIARPIRDMVVFARQDLVLDPPFLRLDLVSCRNLLIYFQPLLQTRVLSIFHFALRPAAYLFLGKSESIVHQDNLFSPVSKEARIFVRVASKDQMIPIPLYTSQEAGVKQPITIAERTSRKPESRLQKALSEIYAPPSVLINREMDIVEVHGDMQSYLHFPAGKLEMNLAQLLRREWRTEVQTLVHHAELKRTNAMGRIRPVKHSAGLSVQIEVHPVASRDDQKLFLISFISLTAEPGEVHPEDRMPVNSSELEDELIATREHLQTVIEELETSNEELQALNEEMQAANEELQSSNEELEASNEELQSTNEELTTVNEELIVKGGELSLVNTELENLQNSTGFSLILLDQELRLQRYNKEAASLFGFSVHTLGKSIPGLAVPVIDVLETAKLAMSDGIKRQKQMSFGGKHYNVLCFPYTSQDQTLGGVIVTFIDQTELMEAQQEILSSKDRLTGVMQNSPMLISIKDPAGRYQFVNNAFESIFALTPGSAIGNTDTQIFPESIAVLFEKLHFDVLHKKNRVEAEERILIGDQQHWLSFICYPINDEKGSVGAVCSQVIIVTARRELDEQKKLTTKFFDAASEGLMITDSHQNIIKVNHAFVRMTGYDEADVIGKNPSLLSSGKHEDTFYSAMWQEINQHGWWQGELWNRRKDGTHYLEWLTIHTLRDEHGHLTNYIAIFSDITLIKAAQRRLEYMVAHDELTSLPNRNELRGRMAQTFARAQRHGGTFALMFIDLDNFKNVNDNLGHDYGDVLLQQVAERLGLCVRTEDTVARIGGDEFNVLLDDVSETQIANTAQRILDHVSKPYLIKEQQVFVSASIGIAVYPKDAEDIETLTKNADSAMYQAKDKGKDSYQFFTSDLKEKINHRIEIGNALHKAIDANELKLVYQPEFNLQTGELIGAEALLRWHSSLFGIVGPDEFIPIAEESDLILELGEWVIEQAARQLNLWRKADTPLPGTLFVNVAPRQLARQPLLAIITRQLQKHRLPSGSLGIEITERTLVNSSEDISVKLHKIELEEIPIAIDDFGTGYSSLSYLKSFPISFLKIPNQFIDGITTDESDKGIATAIHGVSVALKLQTIAEGIETEDQLIMLREMGCQSGQGYLLGRPVDPNQFVELFISNRKSHVR
ncbi:EAL domain-containing protein [Gallionella capsiferriformans]|jgi:two-component system CheB/CheR fusion protein|uniref:protein-glutamate O-methyltransferase n=1 Tax=Gallionella capsiferriformans (strain ES-2) TaxID=395494 RepID=D9SIA4_GALCS|nr:EAL domain-containing protein [Gallionella capsiferriformans]ADL54161.1 diguanylate cyclase/phosphodiesterase with PAS/PAC sensor(s) [Gallionella capsiferriformans ES-2]